MPVFFFISGYLITRYIHEVRWRDSVHKRLWNQHVENVPQPFVHAVAPSHFVSLRRYRIPVLMVLMGINVVIAFVPLPWWGLNSVVRNMD